MSLSQLIVNAGTNYYQLTQNLSANSGLILDFIHDLAALGTENFYCLLQPNRIESLQVSQIMTIISKNMRMDPEILLGLVALFHKESGWAADQGIDKFISEITNTLGIIQNA